MTKPERPLFTSLLIQLPAIGNARFGEMPVRLHQRSGFVISGYLILPAELYTALIYKALSGLNSCCFAILRAMFGSQCSYSWIALPSRIFKSWIMFVLEGAAC